MKLAWGRPPWARSALGVGEDLRDEERGDDALLRAPIEEDVLDGCGRGGADAEHAGAAGLDDGGLLGGDGLDGIAEHVHVVESHTGHGDGPDALDSARGVPAAAHAALEHGDVDALLGVDHAGGHREQVELGDVVRTLPRLGASRVHALPRRLGSGDTAREPLLGDGRALDLHALGVRDELGARVERRAIALRHEDGGGVARGRGLAVGAGDLDRLEAAVGISQLVQHVLDGLEQGANAELEHIVENGERALVRERGDFEGNAVGLAHRLAFFP